MTTSLLRAQEVTPYDKINPFLLRRMLDQSREAILVVRPDDLNLLDVNIKACEMLSFLPEELIGKSVTTIECSLLDVFFWEELAQEPLFDGFRSAQTEWKRSDGSLFHVEKRIASYTEHGQNYWIIYSEDLTRRKESDYHQLQVVSRLQSSLEATAEGIMAVNLTGQVVNMNRRFSFLWDLPEATLVDNNVSFMWGHIFANLINASNFLSSLELAQVEPHTETEDMLSLRDGRYFICVSKPEFLRDVLVGRVFSVRDITVMKKIETDLLAARDIEERVSHEKSRMLEALKLSESRLRRLVNSNLIGIMQGDIDGSIIEANDVLLGLIGVDRNEFEQDGLNWLTLISPTNHKTYENALTELQTNGQSAPFEVQLTCQGGPRVPAMVGLAQLEGSTTEWVGFVLDLSKQRESDRVKSDFISLVSHELRTPLTSIQGSLGLLEGGACGEIPASALNLIKIALKNSKRLSILVTDLLDLEKISTGKMTLYKERIDLIALTRQSLEVNSGYAQALNVTFRIKHCPEHAWCYCDSNRLMQVFANLMSNAVKFSTEGGYVDISVHESDGFYRVEITDHGQGIPLEFRTRIFKKFAQADDVNTRRQGGSGLGLNITQNLIEKMGGEIGFDSTLGAGTTFWFTVEASVQSSNK